MEKTKKEIQAKRVGIFILALLFLPMLHQLIGLPKFKSLVGYQESKSFPEFSVERWFDGQFQDEFNPYINNKVGLRSWFVRINNQIYYSFYNLAKANGVIIGKHNYLYEENYIKAHLGRDFIGDSLIKSKTKKIEVVSQILTELDIPLIIVIAPGKGSFHSEFIPDRFFPDSITRTNYEAYKNEFAYSSINFIDMKKWFSDLRTQIDMPLFPKTGIHWSKYAEVLVADSLAQYIADIKNVESINYVINSVEYSSSMKDTDDDIERGMNLMFDIPDLKMAYPQYAVQFPDSLKKQKVLSVADSYYWGLFNMGLSRDVFDNGQFWFYNVQIYPDSFEKELKVEDVDIKSEILKNDAIILLTTDANLYRLGFGFIDGLYSSFLESDTLLINEFK